jgi:hypothetical protein
MCRYGCRWLVAVGNGCRATFHAFNSRNKSAKEHTGECVQASNSEPSVALNRELHDTEHCHAHN